MKIITFLFILMSISSFSQIEENLLLHYKFDGSVFDETENSFDGIANNITYTADRFGNENSAAYFNGVNSFIDFPNLAVLKPQLPVTFSFWIRYDGNNYQDRAVFNTSFEEDISSGIFFNAEAGTGKYGVSFGDGSPAYTPSTRRSYSSNVIIVTNEWHHITIVVADALNMEIYLDCKEGGGSYSGSGGTLFYSSTSGSLGRHDRELGAPADYFKGAIDDFKYWDRALSFDEIYNDCHNLEIQEINRSSLIIYPNPAQNTLHIQGNWDANATVQILDTLGKKLLSSSLQHEMDISNLPNGIYFVKFLDKASVSSKKLIIKR